MGIGFILRLQAGTAVSASRRLTSLIPFGRPVRGNDNRRTRRWLGRCQSVCLRDRKCRSGNLRCLWRRESSADGQRGNEWGGIAVSGKRQYEAAGQESTEFFGVTESSNHVPNENRIVFWAECASEVDRLAEFAIRAGARNVEGPMPYEPGYYAVFFEDPFGNRLEVCHQNRRSSRGPKSHTTGLRQTILTFFWLQDHATRAK